MDRGRILHDIAMKLQDNPEFKEGCSAGWTATSGSIRITDPNGNKFTITVQSEPQEATL